MLPGRKGSEPNFVIKDENYQSPRGDFKFQQTVNAKLDQKQQL